MNHKETNSNEEHVYNKKPAGNSVDQGNALFYDLCDAKKKKITEYKQNVIYIKQT